VVIKLTVKELKEKLSKFNDDAQLVIIFKSPKNKLVYTDEFEIYNRTQLKNDKLITDKNMVFIDISNG
jgi:hypothetical protein